VPAFNAEGDYSVAAEDRPACEAIERATGWEVRGGYLRAWDGAFQGEVGFGAGG
jgi:hypothetical protein